METALEQLKKETSRVSFKLGMVILVMWLGYFATANNGLEVPSFHFPILTFLNSERIETDDKGPEIPEFGNDDSIESTAMYASISKQY